MKTIEEIEADIVEEFDWIEDDLDRYEHIIDIGKELAPLDKAFKSDEFIVKGCQSKVWLRAEKRAEKVYFQADSNTLITKGIVALLVRVLSGQSSQDILDARLSFIDKIALREHLTSQRSNGLTAMIQKMKLYAQVYNV